MSTPAGWYDDGAGRQRWWDGVEWTDRYAPTAAPAPAQQAPVQVEYAGRKANKMPVSYTREQKGHSLTGWIIASVLLVIPLIWVIYYSVSPNHYWHA
ncbi:hypothetical protein GCM10028798_09770 [Humibacter antri]